MIDKYLFKESSSDLPSDHKFNGLDLVKFFCAFLICMIHIRPFNAEFLGISRYLTLDFWLQQYLCRIAVPFYFVTAGFLLYRKIDLNNFNKERIKNYCFKLLRLLGVWNLLLFAGSRIQLWYLNSLIVSVIILSILIKKNVSFKKIFLIAFILFIIGLLGESYYGFIAPFKSNSIFRFLVDKYKFLFETTRNGLFFGLIFTFVGIIFSKVKIVMNNKIAIGGLLLSFILMFFETFFLKHHSNPRDYNFVLSLLPTTFFLFYIASHIKLKNRPIYESLRIIGMIIFFTHNFVNYFVTLFNNYLVEKTGHSILPYQFIISVSITLTIAIIIERLSKKDSCKWLKYIYS